MNKNSLQQKEEYTHILLDFDSVYASCPFKTEIESNNGYGCSHPKQEEINDGEACCYRFSCPLGIEPDEETLESNTLDFNGVEREDLFDANGVCIANIDYLVVPIGKLATDEQKETLKRYNKYVNRYN